MGRHRIKCSSGIFLRIVGLILVWWSGLLSVQAAADWLTADERAWLETHRDELIIGSDSTYQPYLFVGEDGQLSGYWGDATARIEELLGVSFRLQRYDTFNEVLDAARLREIAIVPCVVQSEEREAYLAFSRPLITIDDMIITRKDRVRVTAIEDLSRMKVGYVDGYSVGDRLKMHAPQATLVPVTSEVDGLQRLALGELDVLIADAGVASWHAQRLGLASLRFSGTLGLGASAQSYGVRSDWPELAGILDKAVGRLTPDDQREMTARWVTPSSHTELQLQQVILRLTVFALLGLGIGAGILFWNYALRRQVLRRTAELEEELVQRRKVESEKALLATAVQQSAGHILTLDGRHCIQYANPAFIADTGYLMDELSGKPMSDLVCDRSDAGLDPLWETLRAGDVWRGRLRTQCRDGRALHVEVTATPIRDPHHAAHGAVISFHDRTHEEELEQQLQHTQKMQAVGLVAGGVAHDFNNLLTPILAGTELVLLDEDLSDQAREDLHQVTEAALRAKELIGQIMVFSRQGKSRRRPVNLAEVLGETLALLRSSIPASITIATEVEEDVPTILGDMSQLQSVILNVGTNAYHAMEETGGALTIKIAQQEITVSETGHTILDLPIGSYCCLTFTDTGMGMPQEVRDRIFEPYFTTKQEGQGIGLGLATVHGIVQSHGGGVQVTSEAGSGSTFTFYFPVHRVDGEVRSVAATAAVPSGRGHRILLVDDDSVVLRVHAAMLRRLGYRVDPCLGPEAALAEFSADGETLYDLVLSDLNMPGMSGIELAEQLRAQRPEQPVVIISGGGKKLLETQLPVVYKPIQLEELAVVIQESIVAGADAITG